ncbi:cellulose binding domain-containing protein [Myceligenerans pegani]|uniref:cellulose binding domain-containing protein n=1 Tax=Myceligenerans pegani TaxID=2776917 RepID=UPI00299E7696|nr:cellulose binding domain-containing protein [Myceligenerans sp. TRM 65318]
MFTKPRHSAARRIAVAAAAATALAATLLAAPAAIADDPPPLVVEYRTSATSPTADQVEPWFQVRNTGSSSVALADVTLRYYFTADVGAQYRFACSWAVRGCANVTGTFGEIADPGAAADRYLEVGFRPGAGTLAPGESTSHLQLRFHRTDWQRIDQSDDYSFDAARTSYAASPKVTARVGGELVWGTAPGAEGPGDPTDPPTDPTDPPEPGPLLFDDFDYTGHTDQRLSQRGWTVKSGAGGPGAPGAVWAPENITFPTEGGNTLMNLETSTNGTASGTRQSELYHQRKFTDGTYAARVRFSDAPRSGPDGDHMVQTFFTITPLDAPMDPDYGELDFEYLPNGGWGEPSNILYATSWETYRPDPWEAVNTHTEERTSFAGWHDLVITVDRSLIRYYVDGRLFATHGEPYLPETPMSINFNHWIISGGLVGSGTPRAYDQKVDYVYYAQDQTLTPAQVQAAVDRYRADAVSHLDTVP